MSHSIQKHFQQNRDTLAIYFTAGYPTLESTLPILRQLDQSTVGLIEIGMPFSDPLADGPVIQDSSHQALLNGMSINKLFEQLQLLRKVTQKPVVLMGYLNPVMQFGMEKFLQHCQLCGIDGLILPDLPPELYHKKYALLFGKFGIQAVFLITPQTSTERIRMIDEMSNSFIYAVSTASTTGGSKVFGQEEREYFARLKAMQLKNPVMVGFGIQSKPQLQTVFEYAAGGIIGSAFIRHLNSDNDFGIPSFLQPFTE